VPGRNPRARSTGSVSWKPAEGQRDRLPGLAAELGRLKVDAIVTAGSRAARAVKDATTSVPIVMATGGDPVGLGLDRPDELDRALGAIVADRAGAALVATSPMFLGSRRQLAELALTHHLPLMFAFREYAEASGLMAYGPSYVELFQRAAGYGIKILRRAKPGDLPVEQPTTFELVLNPRTARRSAFRSRRRSGPRRAS
jgi:ABC-type uncharacterized transport system substrate-binding protein